MTHRLPHVFSSTHVTGTLADQDAYFHKDDTDGKTDLATRDGGGLVGAGGDEGARPHLARNDSYLKQTKGVRCERRSRKRRRSEPTSCHTHAGV